MVGDAGFTSKVDGDNILCLVVVEGVLDERQQLGNNLLRGFAFCCAVFILCDQGSRPPVGACLYA